MFDNNCFREDAEFFKKLHHTCMCCCLYMYLSKIRVSVVLVVIKAPLRLLKSTSVAGSKAILWVEFITNNSKCEKDISNCLSKFNKLMHAWVFGL